VIEPLTIEPLPQARKRSHAVARTALVNRLCAAAGVPVVAVVAPAGFGKTTLLQQWAARDGRHATWHRLDRAFDPEEIAGSVAAPGRLVLVDDVDALRSPAALAALQRLLLATGSGTTVALAARAEPPRRLPRLRAAGRLLEIGAADLTLGDREAQALLRRAGVLLPEQDAARLAELTEGWPAALALAALALRAGVPPHAIGGDDRFLDEYVEAELLATLTPSERRFAEQTCVLDDIGVDGCAALVDRLDVSRMLSALERKGIVVPLDHRRRRYRYRRLVQDALRAELEPQRTRALHRAAAAWSAARGAPEDGLAHALAAEDFHLAAKLATAVVPACVRDGRLAAAERLLEQLDERAQRLDADVCLAGWWLFALRGRAVDARRWADAALRALPPADPRLSLLEALRARDGSQAMRVAADAACAELPPGSAWLPAAAIARAAAAALTGDDEQVDGALVDVLDADAPELRLLASALLERRAAEQGDDPTRVLVAALPRDPTIVHVLVLALSARAALHAGDRDAANEEVERADALAPLLTPAVPWLAAVAGLELARAHAALGDADRARLVLRRVGDVLHARPGFPALVAELDELDARVRALAKPEGRWATSLTRAELRLLPLLATHLSFREIGQRLYVSRNTVKTQAISIYRKFGVSSRSDAIARAAELGLLDEAAHRPVRTVLVPARPEILNV
jgi:LuxR family maltose regulon positive regulatory protein